MQNAKCSFFIAFVFLLIWFVSTSAHFNRQKMPVTNLTPKAWEEMQEEGLEANAVGESQPG